MTKNTTLTGKVVSGTAWLFAFQIFDNILGLIRLFILARILTPADFGLIGVAMLTKQVLDTFTQTGIGAVLVYKKDAEEYLNVSWTFLLFRGIILAGLVYLAAPLFGMFFNSQAAVEVIRVVGLTFLIDACANISVILFQKHLQFFKVFVMQLIGNLLDAVVAITMALILKNAWGIVAGLMVNSIARVVLSYVLSDYRPRFDFSFNRIREMNRYGKWVFGSTVLQFLYGQADDILVGRVLGTTALGFYQLAYRISNLPTTQITNVVNNVMFPAYAQVQDIPKRMISAYIRTFQFTAFLSLFVGTIIILFAQEFIMLFLKDQWLPMTTTLQLLTVWGIIRSLGATTGAFWKAKGTPETITKIQFVQAVIMVVLIYPFTIWWGYLGTAISVVVAAVVSNIIAFIAICKTLQVPFTKLFIELAIPILAAGVSSLVVIYIQGGFLPQISFLNFFFGIALFSILYLFSLILLAKLFKNTLFVSILNLLESSVLGSKFPDQFRIVRNYL